MWRSNNVWKIIFKLKIIQYFVHLQLLKTTWKWTMQNELEITGGQKILVRISILHIITAVPCQIASKWILLATLELQLGGGESWMYLAQKRHKPNMTTKSCSNKWSVTSRTRSEQAMIDHHFTHTTTFYTTFYQKKSQCHIMIMSNTRKNSHIQNRWGNYKN